MLILGLLGMYFDAAVVFFTNSSLFFRMAMAVLWCSSNLAIKLNAVLYDVTRVLSPDLKGKPNSA